MKNISAPMKAYLGNAGVFLSTCVKFTRTDGQVFGFTDAARDITIAGWTSPNSDLNGSYEAAVGYRRSDIATSSDLNVDNVQAQGVLESPNITEADLLAGLWDHAYFSIFTVNPTDLTMGPVRMRAGWLREVTIEKPGEFKADLDGLMQAYARTIGRVDAPNCDANLGDARCLQDMTTFTKTGTIASVSADGLTLYDPARTEPGPTGGIAITGITNANPGVVTMAAAPVPAFTPLQLVTISGVVGMTPVNTVVVVHNPSGATFQFGFSTSDTGAFPPYVSGGTVTPLGGDSGFFDFGVITFTSGANNGLSMDIKSYVPGQITLWLPFPYTIAPSDAYSIKAGCDKSLQTCRDRFNNLVHFRGSPYMPGLDKVVQVGRHQ